MPRLRLRLLGGFRAELDSAPLPLPRKVQALLALLAVSAGRPQPRGKLAGLLWGASPEQQAQFDEWFVNQHIEDTAHCPNFIRGRVYKLAGPHLALESVSKYISIYEVDAPSYEEAERVQLHVHDRFLRGNCPS